MMMTSVYMINQVDRQLMMVLLEPIKEDLMLSDTQLGLLTGIVFGLFYATLGVPIARWADRGNRVTITSCAIGLWGLTVMGCMFVTNYAQLVIARIAAAVGEAGGKPPMYSLLGDYFVKPAERTRALAIFSTSSSLAALVSLILGGWLNEHYGWRMTFLLMGIPGLVLAVLVKWTLREPRAEIKRAQSASTLQPSAASMKTVLLTIWRQHSCRHLCIALILIYMLAMGMAPWFGAFLMRSHGMGTAELGLWLGVIFGVGGTAGSLLGGYVASHWFANDERAQMRTCALTVASLMPSFLAFLLVPEKQYALMALVPLIIGFQFFLGPTYALMQRLVGEDMRATLMAVIMLLANLIGFGVGPLIVGFLSDALRPSLAGESLRYAMLAMSLTALWAGYHFWLVGRSIRSDLLAVASRGESAQIAADSGNPFTVRAST